MKDSIHLINNLKESNIIDFNKGKEKLKQNSLDKLNPNDMIDAVNIFQALDNIIFNAKKAQQMVQNKQKVKRVYMDDLISLRDELIYLYQDMFKEED